MRVRMLLVLLFSFLFVFLAWDSVGTGQVRRGSALETFTGYLDRRIPSLMNKYEIPGANIAIVTDGVCRWTKAYGYAELETGRKMTTDTPLRVQSISKPVTAWGVLKLVEQGKIDLDAPVMQYLSSWEFPQSEFLAGRVTTRQLLNHSSGLPLGNIFNRYSPEEELPTLRESLAQEAVLVQEPGLSFSYSNVGFNLLELLIEEVTGRDFAEYMEQEILVPLGMDKAGFNWSPGFNPAVPNGYDLNGTAIPVYIYSEKGSGGLFATAEDIATFIAAGMPDFSRNRQVLSPQSIDQLYTPTMEKLGVYSLVFDSYGLGYYIESLSDGKQAVSHGGQGTGWMSHFHSVPETGDGIVILTNSQRSWPLIAYILKDWAEWRGLDSVGMEKIIVGKHLLCALVALIWCVVLWQVWAFVTRRREHRLLSFGKAIAALVLAVALWWCGKQDYLFISSVFPLASRWLGISLLFLVIALLLPSSRFQRMECPKL
jgi:CubicO group peptidase (beta-lactamase class C family)